VPISRKRKNRNPQSDPNRGTFGLPPLTDDEWQALEALMAVHCPICNPDLVESVSHLHSSPAARVTWLHV
jgi:hypothetical protein